PRERAEREPRRPAEDRPDAREHQLERTAAQLLRRRDGGVERLPDLGLQPRLLVEADLEVREHGELRARRWVGLGMRALVVPERPAEVVLPVGWVARPEAVEESRVRRLGEEARELEPDLLEHRQVPARDGRA